MKKFTLNQIVSLPSNLISVQHQFYLTLNRVLFILVFTISVVNISAQNIKSLDKFQTESGYTEKTHFQSLFNEESTIAIHDSKIEFDAESAMNVIVVDLNSINQLYIPNSKFASIELIKIKLNDNSDLNRKIDLSKLSHLGKMKYILIVSSIEVCPENEGNLQCQSSKIQNMFLTSENVNPTIVFRIITPM
ncbi:hypothetical protein [Flavobacterium sp.]|uniref:hypothetical protein n=1 Tax=Flavobacterium sp. TaxID=239 RepID=UPI0037C075DD